MKLIKFEFLKFLFAVIVLAVAAFSQSGKKDVQTAPTPTVDQSVKTESQTVNEEFQFVLLGDFNKYVEELNRLGKLGYRVEKAFNYGGDAANMQRFAAVLRLDPEAAYEYDWITSPNRKFIESRLNSKAEKGFYVTHILPITGCIDSVLDKDTIEFPTIDTLLKLTKGDVFLLEKPAGKSEKVREYKVYTGKIGIGKSPTTELQNALDNAPVGFHPVKVLFNKDGTFDLTTSVLLEKDLKNTNTEKIQYKFFKDVNGFEKEINANAQNGYQLIAGRRIGLVKLALLAKVPGDAVSYILIDADKYDREFPKKIAPGNVYKGMFLGDTSCDEYETLNARLVFAQTADASRKPEYKFLKISDQNSLPNDDAITKEVIRHFKDGYRVRDIFYGKGAVLIMEK